MRKAKYGMEYRRYIPVSMRKGKIEGAVMVTDLPEGDKWRKNLYQALSQVTTPDVAEGTTVDTLVENPINDR